MFHEVIQTNKDYMRDITVVFNCILLVYLVIVVVCLFIRHNQKEINGNISCRLNQSGYMN